MTTVCLFPSPCDARLLTRPGVVTVDGNKVKELKDFTNLSSQMQKATPTGVNSDDYKPTNSPRSCPSVGSHWRSSKKLPPSPDQQLCSCMENSLSCHVKDSVSDKEIGKLFGLVCGYGVCDGISSNSTTGEYGAYSMCRPRDKLSFVMNRYYQQQGESDKACDFDGAATVKSAKKPTGTCKALLDQAGKGGKGTVTSIPTGVGQNADGSSAETSESSGAASPLFAQSAVFPGAWQLWVYVGSAIFAGAGMIWL